MRGKLPWSSVLSSKSSPLRSQESLGNGFPPSVMQVSLTLSPDLCLERKSPWIWGGEGGSVMQKFNRIADLTLPKVCAQASSPNSKNV